MINKLNFPDGRYLYLDDCIIGKYCYVITKKGQIDFDIILKKRIKRNIKIGFFEF